MLTARLADAEFFWQNDLRTPLADMAAKLDSVTFHNKLGTQGERIARIAALAREIAPAVGADPDLAERAARLAKADLASQMVYEFPELQGTMGRYYAERAGEDPAVAAAAEEHYAPLGPSDAVPTAPVSVAVALADKIDMLTAFWSIDEKPTGSKDPFALRRAAVGLIRLLLGTGRGLDLGTLFAHGIINQRGGFAELEEIGRAITEGLDEHRIILSSLPLRYEEMRDFVKSMEESDQKARMLEAIIAASDIVSTTRQQQVEDLLYFISDRLKNYLREQGFATM